MGIINLRILINFDRVWKFLHGGYKNFVKPGQTLVYICEITNDYILASMFSDVLVQTWQTRAALRLLLMFATVPESSLDGPLLY